MKGKNEKRSSVELTTVRIRDSPRLNRSTEGPQEGTSDSARSQRHTSSRQHLLRPTFSVHVYGRDIGNAEASQLRPGYGRNKPLRLWVLQCPTRPRKILAGQLSARLPPNLPPGHLSGTRLAYGLSRNELAPFPLGI